MKFSMDKTGYIRKTQELEAAFSHYKSADNRRIALRNALARKPQDPRLHEVLKQLTGPQHISRALRHGIFINYIRSDELFALELAESLRKSGVKVWLDMVDMDYNHDWYEEINRAMQNCGMMIAIISPASLRNRDAAYERRRFMDAGKLVLPVLREHCEISRMDFWLQPIDFSRDFKTGLLGLRQMIQTAAASV